MTRTSYDDLPYESHSYPQTHPDNLAVIATLRGMSPAAVERCRVLELGCGRGCNLVPMAHGLPETRFVGIDSSERQIGDAGQFAGALGLKNVELRTMDLMGVGPDLGQFDFIICHGVYSWVPGPVQEKILEICAQNLALNGVAYVSYNTFPGWFLRGTVAEMLHLHARRFNDPVERVRQARAFLELMAEFTPDKSAAFAAVLQEERGRLRSTPDSHLFHEQLAELNDPIYFYQFNERARAKGLEYLAEARLLDMSPMRFDEKVQKALPKMAADPIDQEQYMDFLMGRSSRQTLLCHQGIFRERTLTEGHFERFMAASPVRPANPETDPRSPGPEEFVTPTGSRVGIASVTPRAALRLLGESWPQALGFRTLLEQARASAGLQENDTQALADTLFRCCHWGIVDLHLHWPHFITQVSERPVADPVARYQAENGRPITNLLHQNVVVSDLERLILPCLNGGNDHAALLQLLQELLAAGQIRPRADTAADSERLLQPTLDQTLPRLARQALLVG
jgi:methyltransferase-like protein/2-polyprenyl-3-methyl-5-hydroxy-6-metoxy-1,4-benzoquinol methylase